jgi:hypothetical protein
MEPAVDGPEFSELLFTSGIELPVRTRVEVITPALRELDVNRLRRIKESSCTVELFVLGEQIQATRQLYGQEFPIFPVQDFGSELIYQ